MQEEAGLPSAAGSEAAGGESCLGPGLCLGGSPGARAVQPRDTSAETP